MLKVRFFGTPQISFGSDTANVLVSGRIQALFTYLCVTRQPQDRSKLADLLWDHQSDQEAKNNLRYVLRDLRKLIGDYLVIEGQTVAFNFDLPHWFDITSFTTYLAPSMGSASSEVEPTVLQELLNLYTGDFLAGFYIQDAPNFERWMLAQRRHFHDAMVYGLQLAAQQHLALGEYDAGLALNQYLLTLEPWREESHCQRMILLAASGQRSAALMQYELCCQILEEELDAPPMNETTSLYKQIKSGLWFIEHEAVETFNNQRIAVRSYPKISYQRGPALYEPSDATAPTAPKSQVDLGTMPSIESLIGRQQQLCALQRWLDDDSCQLAAILGLQGQGKSTLAARFVQAQYMHLEPMPVKQRSAQPQQIDSQSVQGWPFPPSTDQEDALRPKDHVTRIIWRSLAQRPSTIELLQDWIQQITSMPRAEMTNNFDQLSTILFTALHQQSCLLVLDGVDAILTYNNTAEQVEAEAYEQLFRLFMERQHHSFLLLTSRLRPTVLSHTHQQKQSARCLELDGLTQAESKEFLATQGLETAITNYQQLHDWYAGNPRMLSQVADVIHELFDGDVNAFLQEEIHFLDNIGASLVQQLMDLSLLQKQIMHLLAVAGQPLTRQNLWAQLTSNPPKEAYYNALRDLQRAYLIQQISGGVTATTLPAIFLRRHAALLWD